MHSIEQPGFSAQIRQKVLLGSYNRNFMVAARSLEVGGIIPASLAQGGAEGSVRVLLTKNPACSFTCPLPGTRYLV